MKKLVFIKPLQINQEGGWKHTHVKMAISALARGTEIGVQAVVRSLNTSGPTPPGNREGRERTGGDERTGAGVGNLNYQKSHFAASSPK